MHYTPNRLNGHISIILHQLNSVFIQICICVLNHYPQYMTIRSCYFYNYSSSDIAIRMLFRQKPLSAHATRLPRQKAEKFCKSFNLIAAVCIKNLWNFYFCSGCVLVNALRAACAANGCCFSAATKSLIISLLLSFN